MKLTRRQKIALIYAATVILFVIWIFQPCFWTYDYAKSQAQLKIRSQCISDGRDPSRLSQLRDAKIGGTAWAFEAVYEGSPRYLYGYWISKSGHTEFYGGDPDEPQSAAYEPKKKSPNKKLHTNP